MRYGVNPKQNFRIAAGVVAGHLANEVTKKVGPEKAQRLLKFPRFSCAQQRFTSCCPVSDRAILDERDAIKVNVYRINGITVPGHALAKDGRTAEEIAKEMGIKPKRTIKALKSEYLSITRRNVEKIYSKPPSRIEYSISNCKFLISHEKARGARFADKEKYGWSHLNFN